MFTEKYIFCANPLAVSDFELRSLSVIVSTHGQVRNFLLRPNLILLCCRYSCFFLLLHFRFLIGGHWLVLLTYLCFYLCEGFCHLLLLAICANIPRVENAAFAMVLHNVLLLLFAND